jgi:hypothetical protein
MKTCRTFKKEKVLFPNRKRQKVACGKPNRMAGFFKEHE